MVPFFRRANAAAGAAGVLPSVDIWSHAKLVLFVQFWYTLKYKTVPSETFGSFIETPKSSKYASGRELPVHEMLSIVVLMVRPCEVMGGLSARVVVLIDQPGT